MAKNAVLSYGALLVQVVMGILLTPILFRALGEHDFGVFTVLLTLVGYVGVVELGIGTASVRRVASAGARRDERELEAVASTSRFIYGIIAAAGAVILFGLILLLPNFVDASDANAGARYALLVMGAAQLIGLALNVFPALLFGLGRSDLLTMTGVSVTVVGGFSQICLVLLTHDLLVAAIVTAATSISTSVLIRVIARRKLFSLDLQQAKADRTIAKELLSSGWRNAVIGIAATAAVSSDVLVVSALLPIEAVAAYGIAVRASGVIRALTSKGAEVLIPTFAHHSQLNQNERLYLLYRESLIASWLLSIPAAICVALAGADLLELWLGVVPEGSVRVLMILTFAVVLAAPGTCAYNLLSGMNRLTFMMIGGLVGSVINLGLSISLTLTIGLIGPALGTLFTIAVFDMLVLPVYVCRVLQIPLGRLVRDCQWLLVPTIVSASAGLLTMRINEGFLRGLPTLLVSGGAFLICGFVTAGRPRRLKYFSLLRRSAKTENLQPPL